MTIRTLNESGIELKEEEINLALGYLIPDQIFLKEHPPVEEVKEVYHYVVKTFYFTDGSKLNIDSENDPHVKIVDNQVGHFEYIDLGEGKAFHGADVVKVIDVERIPAQSGWKEYETINRYILYTEEELIAQKKEKEQMEKQTDFLATGPDRLTNTELSLDDLILLMAEMIGG